MRSKGSIALQSLGTVTEVAQLTGKSVSYISYVMSGRKEPSKAFKEICAELPGGPSLESWSETVVDPEIKRLPSDEPLEPPTPDGVRDMAAQLMRSAQELQAAIEQEGSAYERIRYLEKLTGIVVDLGKLTGATIINERMLKNSPGWKATQALILSTLEPWPDAMRALATALEESE